MLTDITWPQKRKILRIDNNKKMPMELFYYPFFYCKQLLSKRNKLYYRICSNKRSVSIYWCRLVMLLWLFTILALPSGKAHSYNNTVPVNAVFIRDCDGHLRFDKNFKNTTSLRWNNLTIWNMKTFLVQSVKNITKVH